MRAVALSGFGSKGPACFLVEIGGRRLLLDCGKGPDHGRLPDLSGVGRVDAVLVSHAHADHTGALDLAQSLGAPPVYATALTAHIAALANCRELPLSGETEVAGISVLTGRCGHAPGAVWMRLGGAEGLLYTGDFSAEDTLFAHDPWPEAALLIFDASYGAHDCPLREGFDALDRLARQGPLLLPSPAAGRGLGMAMLLHEASHRVRLCPEHRALAEKLTTCGAALTPGGTSRLGRVLEQTEELHEQSPPGGVMIAAKPNADGGLASRLAARWQNNSAVQIVFTGHRAEGGPADRMVRNGEALFMRWNVHPRVEDIARLFDACGARAAMPAFLPEKEMAALVVALPERPLVSQAEFGLDI